jgi:hypothetical protein
MGCAAVRVISRVCLPLALGVLVSSVAQGKCATRFVHVSGSVVDATGAAAAGVAVGVAWTEDDRPVGPAMTLTDADGHYTIGLEFHTDSSQWLFTDHCNAELDEITVAAYGSTHRSGYFSVDAADQTRIDIAPLRLDYPIERTPTWPDDRGR